MPRSLAVILGTSALALAGLALGPGDVKARAKDADEDRNVDRRVQVIRLGGGGGFLGVRLQEVDEGRGARVDSVEPDSPAAKAGVKEGDVIVRFDGEAVRSALQLTRLVRETPADRAVPIEVTRGGVAQKLSATLDEGHGRFRYENRELLVPEPEFDIELPEPPEPPEAPRAPRAPRPWAFGWHGDGDRDFVFRMPGGPRKLGIAYQDISGQLAGYFKLGEGSGVLVTSVDEGGPAAKAGVKAGDVILKLDGKAIRDGGDLREHVRNAEAGTEVALTVQRDGRPVELKVTLAKPEPPKKAAGVGI